MAYFKHKSSFDYGFSFIDKQALVTYIRTFVHKEFMLHKAQGLLPHPVWNAYQDEETKFWKTAGEVPID